MLQKATSATIELGHKDGGAHSEPTFFEWRNSLFSGAVKEPECDAAKACLHKA